MERDVIDALRYFNSMDGPHISIEKLGIYCGIPKSTMSDYMAGRTHPSETNRQQIEKGLSDMLKEMLTEWHI
jgi:hypothetical protein